LLPIERKTSGLSEQVMGLGGIACASSYALGVTLLEGGGPLFKRSDPRAKAIGLCGFSALSTLSVGAKRSAFP